MNREEKQLTAIFISAPVPPGLAKRVASAIERARVFRLRLRLAGFSASAAVSFAGITLVTANLLGSLSNSGFSYYLSLIFTDAGLLVTYWSDFLLSMIESLPILPLGLLFGSLLILLESARSIFADAHHLRRSWKFNF